jgi:hypothetical protein
MLRRLSITLKIFLIALISISTVTAQNSKIFVPKNLLKVYEKGTRSYDGKPGPNYWINHADYKIQAQAFPKERVVRGHETITYFNESPDSLMQLVFRLYQDVMKKGNSRDFRVDQSDLTDGVKIDTLIIGGEGLSFNDRMKVFRNGTNFTVRGLKKPVAPKSSINIEVSWSVIIPKETRQRMGAYNDSTLYVAYWYPQVAVYDDIDGWDRINYGGDVEFYNDINNYELEITVPKNYLVWGTGVYQNLDQVVKPEIASRYKEALESDGVIRIVGEEDLKKGTTIGGDKVTWKLKAEHVSDVSFAVSNGYIWDGLSAVIDANGKRALTDAVYPPQQKAFENVAGYAKLTLETLSSKLPGVPYPFPKMTVFSGEQKYGGGMEMPMMCNNGIYPNKEGQAGVTLHEIAHTYFPFYMGTNERKYAWMDEGWATFFTSAQVSDLEPTANEYIDNIQSVSQRMGNEWDTPAITPSLAARGQMYGFTEYPKASVSYFMLKDALGDELFKKCLHEYMSRWNGKHPIPWDFFFTFNDVAQQDLSWFWNPWYFDHGYPDLAVKDVKTKKDNTVITVEKVGSVPVSIDLIITYADNSTEKIHKSVSVWKNGNQDADIELKTAKEISKVEINEDFVPDTNKKNNLYEVKKK